MIHGKNLNLASACEVPKKPHHYLEPRTHSALPSRLLML